MTNPVVSAAEQAALPSAAVVVSAMQTFFTNVNLADPLGVPARIPGAFTIFRGTIELQAPALAAAEGSAVAVDVNTVLAGWAAKIKSLEAPSA